MKVGSVSRPGYVEAPRKQEFRISKLARRIWEALALITAGVTLATLTVAMITNFTLPLIISSMALAIIVGIEGIKRITPYLPSKLRMIIYQVKATVVDFFAQIACFLSIPVCKLLCRKQNTGKKDQTPVLLIHGYLSHSAHVEYFRYRLKKAGFENVFSITLPNPIPSYFKQKVQHLFHIIARVFRRKIRKFKPKPIYPIEYYEKLVEQKHSEIIKLTNREDLKLVCHSMGGLVYHKAQKIVTLGTPHFGTNVAHIGVGECARQMIPKSKFLSMHHSKIDPKARYLTIATKPDKIVPWRSSLLPNAEQIIFEHIGHVSFLFSDKVIDHTINFLK